MLGKVVISVLTLFTIILSYLHTDKVVTYSTDTNIITVKISNKMSGITETDLKQILLLEVSSNQSLITMINSNKKLTSSEKIINEVLELTLDKFYAQGVYYIEIVGELNQTITLK